MIEDKKSLSDIEKRVIINIISKDELKRTILEELYNVNDFIKTSELYERVERKLSDIAKGKTQSYYLKILRNLEKCSLVTGLKPSIDKKNVYWSITDLGKRIIEEIISAERNLSNV